MSTLAHATQPGRDNNLNAIRLLLALSVIFSHAYPLTLVSGHDDPLRAWTRSQASFGWVAVDLFFFISGLLITASFERSKNFEDFIRKRVLRIYPGFIVATLVSSAVAWWFSPSFRESVSLFRNNGWLGQLIHDMAFLDYSSSTDPQIFATNPFPGTANGSLWTISIEFQCYLLVAVLGLLGLFRKRWLLLAALGFVYFKYFWVIHSGIKLQQLDRRFLALFGTGMVVWLWREKIPLRAWLAAVAAVGLVVAAAIPPYFPGAIPVCGGYLALWVAYVRPLPGTAWCNKIDLSYGTYLYAFPVQQILATVVPWRTPWINFVLAVPITLLLALASWTWVEKPWLKHKKSVATFDEPAVSRAAA